MGFPLKEAEKQQWKENILQQRKSGLSIQSWCGQHGIKPHIFHYWARKLFLKTADRTDFKELVDQDIHFGAQGAGISMEYKGVVIRLEGKFDRNALKECLLVVKEAAC